MPNSKSSGRSAIVTGASRGFGRAIAVGLAAAGAKATIKFVSAYAASESERQGLGIRFVSLLPKLTPATGLGATLVDSYADCDHIDRATFRDRLGQPLTAEQVADAVIHVADHGNKPAVSYLLTADGLTALE